MTIKIKNKKIAAIIINKKETSDEEISFRSLETRSLHSKLVCHQELLSLYSKQDSLSSAFAVDNLNNTKTPVDLAGLEPATPGGKPGYLPYNTTGPKPGLNSLYQNTNHLSIISYKL